MKWNKPGWKLWSVLITLVLLVEFSFGDSPFKPVRVLSKPLPGGWRQYHPLKHQPGNSRLPNQPAISADHHGQAEDQVGSPYQNPSIWEPSNQKYGVNRSPGREDNAMAVDSMLPPASYNPPSLPHYQQDQEWGNRQRRDSKSLTRVQRSSDWSGWSFCNATCGIGYEYRQRTCDDPARCGGNTFDLEFRVCDVGVQCEASWTAWGRCNTTCGIGYEMRQRLCPSPRGCGGRPFEVELRGCDGGKSGCKSGRSKAVKIVIAVGVFLFAGIVLVAGFIGYQKFFKRSTSTGGAKKKATKPKRKLPDEPDRTAPEAPPEPDYVDVADLNTDIVEEDEDGYLIADEEEEPEEPEEEPEGEPEYVDIIE